MSKFNYNVLMKTLFLLLITTWLMATEVEIEILGSGGPEIDGRASASYLLWIDGKARLLVDSGNGSMLRFEQSGAKLEDLEAIVLTHLHIDHVVDLPSYIKAGYFTPRNRTLPILGPVGNQHFPSTIEFIETLFGKKRGLPLYVRCLNPSK
jgi:ribonuclease BN (tRNA processing enzyme)